MIRNIPVLCSVQAQQRCPVIPRIATTRVLLRNCHDLSSLFPFAIAALHDDFRLCLKTALGALSFSNCAQQMAKKLPTDSHQTFVRGVTYGVGGAILGLILYSTFGIVTGFDHRLHFSRCGLHYRQGHHDGGRDASVANAIKSRRLFWFCA